MIELNYIQLYGVIMIASLFFGIIRTFAHKEYSNVNKMLPMRLGAFLVYLPFFGRAMGWW